jgi:uncharacterized phosphosugar-binding protein
MLQLFTTQLINELHKIKNEEAEHIEDVSRTLCNAIIGDGKIYWYATREMKGLLSVVTDGPDAFPNSKIYDKDSELTSLDRLVVATRFATDEDIVELVAKAQQQGTEVIVLTAVKEANDPLEELADFYVDTKMVEGLIPLDGEKIAFPSLMAVLYAYYCIYVTTQEILDDFDSPLPTFE